MNKSSVLFCLLACTFTAGLSATEVTDTRRSKFANVQPTGLSEVHWTEERRDAPKRDAVDERVTETVRTGKTTAVAGPNVRDKLSNPNYSKEKVDKMVHQVSLGIITDIEQVGGSPEYRGEPYKDIDSDGMPDEWETRHGLNPKDAFDAATDLNGDGYTNIEDFINGLDPSAPNKEWPTPQTYEDLWSSDAELKASLDRK